ncbi:MAG TPA: pirin family protein [Rubrivivax sp.]|nr:pirin family protein [Rubrivivax sp.]
MSTRQTLLPREKDLGGGFHVGRLLPAASRQAVGPFLFFDHFGPITAQPQDDHDVRPHPHIGLATVTYLFEGAMQHRDSIGAVQRIEPGAINWMTAGRGIVHSERTPGDLRGVTRRSHGLQLWSALPAEDEELEPAFAHTPASDIPLHDSGGAAARVLIGEAFGLRSPVAARSPTLYLDITLRPGAQLRLPPAAERALYAVDAPFTLDGQMLPARRMVVLEPHEQPLLGALAAARVVLIGGEPLGRRFISWNFVSSRKERILQAQDDWRAQRFDPVPGETEFIPLP